MGHQASPGQRLVGRRKEGNLATVDAPVQCTKYSLLAFSVLKVSILLWRLLMHDHPTAVRWIDTTARYTFCLTPSACCVVFPFCYTAWSRQLRVSSPLRLLSPALGYDATLSCYQRIDMPHNSAVVMWGGCQERYKHSVPALPKGVGTHPIAGELWCCVVE